jgi:hypothetical protein
MKTIRLKIDMEYGQREPVEFIVRRIEKPQVRESTDGTKKEICTEYLSADGQRVGHTEQWSSDQPDSPVYSSLQPLSEPDFKPGPVGKIARDVERPLTLDQALAHSRPPQKGWVD